MQRRQLKVPSEDESLLCVPEQACWADAFAENHSRFQQTDCLIAGVPLQELRERAQAEALAAAEKYLRWWDQKTPAEGAHSAWVVTGHQPELFHPGVWIKNFAVRQFAETHSIQSLNVIIDNDAVKSTALTVPAGNPDDPYFSIIPYDRWNGEIPFEERGILEPELFASFRDRLREEMADYPFRPLGLKLWKHAVDASYRRPNLGEAFSYARRELESEWGCRNWEVPLSHLCRTESFCLLAAELTYSCEQFASIYNSALVEYRRLNGIRSRNHPVADLTHDGSSVEVPFWAWSEAKPLRQHVVAKRLGSSIQLWAGEEIISEFPARSPAQIAQHLQQELGSWKLRPRALITTMYLRLLIADLFVHGVGGGKYDELTDEIIRRFFNLQPPTFTVLSATVKLPVADVGFDSHVLQSLKRQYRDLTWNPDRYLDERVRDVDPAASWIEQKFELMAEEGGDRTERIHRFRQFRKLNEQLAQLLGGLPDKIQQQIEELESLGETAAKLGSREYSIVVHLEDKLRTFLTSALTFDEQPVACAENLSRDS